MPVRVARATMGEIRDLFSRGAIGTWPDGQLCGRAGQAVARITLGAGTTAAGLAIALGLVAVGADPYAAVGPTPRIARQTPVVPVERPAAPKLAIDDRAVSTAQSAEHPSGRAVARLVEQLRRRPARPSRTVGQVGVYLIDAGGGDATLIANEPAAGLNQCGSPAWSHDGRRIVFDATPGPAVGQSDFHRSHLHAIELDGDHLSVRDLGLGNCPDFSPADDRIVFLLNAATEPGDEIGVWQMRADGSGRRPLGSYGRPKWSPQSHQFLIAGFSSPATVTIMDIRPERSGNLDIPGHRIFSVPSWASEGTIVAVLGPAAGPGDTIALVDMTDPARGKVKEVLWKRADGADVLPYCPIYSPVSRRCAFIGKTPGMGRALYAFEPGKPGRPRRLESKDSFDNLIQDPIFSPDGRFVVFSSDRKPPHDPGDEASAR
jgi:hypothetical protein